MALFGTLFFPSIRLSPFAPLLALSYQRLTFSQSLWLAIGVGAILDLMNGELHFGLYALTLVLTTAVLYSQKRHFFEDKALAFSLFTALISAFSTLLLMIFQGVSMSGKSCLANLFLMPAIDGVYAFLWLTCPMRLYTYIEKVGWKTLWHRMVGHENTESDTE
jgi:hypothetical protein